ASAAPMPAPSTQPGPSTVSGPTSSLLDRPAPASSSSSLAEPTPSSARALAAPTTDRGLGTSPFSSGGLDQNMERGTEKEIILLGDSSQRLSLMDVDTPVDQKDENQSQEEKMEEAEWVQEEEDEQQSQIAEIRVNAVRSDGSKKGPRAIWLPDVSAPIRDGLQTWAMFEVWVNGLGQLTPGLRLADSPRMLRPVPNSASPSQHLPQFLEIDPATGGYAPKNDVIAIMRRIGLPPEVVLNIMTKTCTSQPDWVNLCRGFIGNQAATKAYVSIIGPLFFTPAWEMRWETVRRVMPRVSDHRHAKRSAVVEVYQRTLVLPDMATTLHCAVNMWEEHKWSAVEQASIDLIADELLARYHAEGWSFGSRITPLVHRFLRGAHTMLALVRSATRLRKLDLRLGVWALYDTISDAAFYFGPEQLYDLVAGLKELDSISITLGVKNWASNEQHNQDLAIKVEHAIGFRRSLGSTNLDSQQTVLDRKKIRFLRIVVPDAELVLEPDFLFDCLDQVTHFELVCRHLDTRVSALELLYLVAQKFGDTLETLRLVILDDSNTGRVLTPGTGKQATHSTAAPWQPWDDDDGYSDEDFYAEYQHQAALLAQLGPNAVHAMSTSASPHPFQGSSTAATATGSGNTLGGPGYSDPTSAGSSQAGLWYLQRQNYDNPVKLPRLRAFHLECQRLDLDLLRRFDLTGVTHFVLRTEDYWFMPGLSPMPKGLLGSVKVGALGTFTSKKEALEAYRFLFGAGHDEPLVNGDFVLYGMNAELLKDWTRLGMHTATSPSRYVPTVRISYSYEQLLRREAELRHDRPPKPEAKVATLMSSVPGQAPTIGTSRQPADSTAASGRFPATPAQAVPAVPAQTLEATPEQRPPPQPWPYLNQPHCSNWAETSGYGAYDGDGYRGYGRSGYRSGRSGRQSYRGHR
ncbi:hypothetical protein OC835_007488, partial [Tilletia horrida]